MYANWNLEQPEFWRYSGLVHYFPSLIIGDCFIIFSPFEQAIFSKAEKHVKELNLSVDLMKKESKKLLERAALAEKDMKYGYNELMYKHCSSQNIEKFRTTRFSPSDYFNIQECWKSNSTSFKVNLQGWSPSCRYVYWFMELYSCLSFYVIVMLKRLYLVMNIFFLITFLLMW